MTDLRISPDLALPADAVTQTFLVLGKRGSGKSNAAVVMAEEMFRAGLPFVVLDPVGGWWGIKAGVGDKAGLPVYVFGGEHGDLPLEPTAGAVLADVVAEQRIPLVLDLKLFSGREIAQFVADFAERLLRKNSEPLHVFLEEADAVIPQRPFPGEQRMLGAVEKLIRRGRASGLGVTAISQRSAKVNKDATTQAETLIAFRTVGPQDRDVIDAWIKYHAAGSEREHVLASLASLPDGTSWLWSPEWLEKLEQVQWRRRETFDSGATPKAGARPVAPANVADVDLEKLRKQMAATIEKAKADDPRELRKRITALERQVRDSKASAAVAAPETIVEKVVEKVIEIKVLPNESRQLLESAATAAKEQAAELDRAADKLLSAWGKLPAPGSYLPAPNVERNSSGRPQRPTRQLAQVPVLAPQMRTQNRQSHTEEPERSSSNGAFHPLPSHRRILNALAWLAAAGFAPASRAQVAFLAGYTPNSGGYNNLVGTLNTAGYTRIAGAGQLELTEAGNTEAEQPEALPTTEALQGAVIAKVGPSRGRILSALIEAYPKSMTREELADVTGYAPNSGGFNNYIGFLNNTLGVIHIPERGRVAAAPVLFLEDA